MIEFSHVSKQYEHEFDALIDASLFIDKGEFVFLTGPSGAGKTTLLKHIYMEEFATKGQVTICGINAGENPQKQLKRGAIQELRRKIGIVFQDIRLLHDRTVFDNIYFTSRIAGGREKDIKKRVFDALATVGLSHKNSNFPHQLSGGEQQRIAIARAIVNDPLILITDEPTGNLDRHISDEIFTLIRKINSWGTTVIMATHDNSFIERTHYREITLEAGHIVKGGGSRIIRELNAPRTSYLS